MSVYVTTISYSIIFCVHKPIVFSYRFGDIENIYCLITSYYMNFRAILVLMKNICYLYTVNNSTLIRVLRFLIMYICIWIWISRLKHSLCECSTFRDTNSVVNIQKFIMVKDLDYYKREWLWDILKAFFVIYIK